MELLDGRSLKPDELPVTDDCHLYSNVPDSPEGLAVLVNSAGAFPVQIFWALVMVPPKEGLVHPNVRVVTLFGLSVAVAG